MFHHIFFIKQYFFKLSFGIHFCLVAKMFGIYITAFATGTISENLCICGENSLLHFFQFPSLLIINKPDFGYGTFCIQFKF
jgi:hypothetical protein